MSFRSRLLLFFMIIVIVPMIAVALVLFSITADSETGKADAAIAQGLRAAFAVYDGDRAEAGDELEKIARDPQLADALAHRDTAALRRRPPRPPPPPPPGPGPPPPPPRGRREGRGGAPAASPCTTTRASWWSPSVSPTRSPRPWRPLPRAGAGSASSRSRSRPPRTTC